MAIIIDFDEVELDREYSSQAIGGPTYQTSIVGNSRGIHQRNVNLHDAIRSWQIGFEGLTEAQILSLESFFLQRKGMARGFKFFPPQDNQFADDYLGETTLANSYGLWKNYGSVTRRIVKPAHMTPTITMDGYYLPYYESGVIVDPPNPNGLDPWPSPPAYAIEMDWTTGTFEFIDQVVASVTYAPPIAGYELRCDAGEFLVPVVFGTDAFNATRHLTFSEWQSIQLLEILPTNLGIT